MDETQSNVELEQTGESLTGNKDLDSYLDDMVNAANDMPVEESNADKNSEGQFGDEWESEPEKTKEDKKSEEPKDQESEEDEELKKLKNKRNAERRIKNKQRRALSDDEFEKENLRVHKERLELAENTIQQFRPIVDDVLSSGLNRQEVKMGFTFVNKWKNDPVGLAQELLTFLDKRGIKLADVLDHQPDNTRQTVDEEVNRRVQPYVERDNALKAEQMARQQIDTFLSTYPDAVDHLGEIVTVMRHANLTDPYQAYERLRRAYRSNGKAWVAEEEQPSVGGRNVSVKPAPKQPKSMNDLIRENTRNFFRS